MEATAEASWNPRNCRHRNIVGPPPGKYLNVCLDCAHRLIECDGCDAKMVTGPHVLGSGWMEEGKIEKGHEMRWTWCPKCWDSRH